MKNKNKNQNFFYAVFKETEEGVEVDFPDLNGCLTSGDTWELAFENASDALAGWWSIAVVDHGRSYTPSTKKQLSKKKLDGELVPIKLDQKLVESYETTKRFNVTFPSSVLSLVDDYRKKHNLKRSNLLAKAVKEYIHIH